MSCSLEMGALSKPQFTVNLHLNFDVYLHWDSFSPNSWKVGTLESLLLRAFVVCCNEQLLNRETEHHQNVFHHTNGYPKAVIQNVISKILNKYFTLIHSQILFARSQFYFGFMVSNPLLLVFIS